VSSQSRAIPRNRSVLWVSNVGLGAEGPNLVSEPYTRMRRASRSVVCVVFHPGSTHHDILLINVSNPNMITWPTRPLSVSLPSQNVSYF
jgi:hypothetical protein